jgi:hypothetical protein
MTTQLNSLRRPGVGLFLAILMGGCVFAIIMAIAGGCGSGSAVGHIKGFVRLNGKPLSGGTVQFKGIDGKDKYAPISPTGEYRIREVPQGEAKIAVLPASPDPFPGKLPRKSDIPVRYQNPGTSGLTHQVTRGEQDRDIDLEP